MSSILIPVDFAFCSLSACQFGVNMAQRLGAKIYLFHAYQLGETNGINVSRETAELNLNNIIDRIKELAKPGDASFQVEKILREGDALDSISDVAKELAPDMIVISTSSIGDRVKRVLGSKSYKIIRSVEIPVLSLPDEFTSEPTFPLKLGFVAGGDIETMQSFSKLIQLAGSIVDEIHFFELCPFGKPETPSELGLEIQSKINALGLEIQFVHHFLDEPSIMPRIDKLAKETGLGIMSVSTQKRKFLSRLLFPGLMKHLYFNFELPMLILHS